MNAERLLNLAEHLESGKLGHSHFNFNVYSRGSRKKNGCGTTGCAIGECPMVWPEEWIWRPISDGNWPGFNRWEPVIDRFDSPSLSACHFFGIEERQYKALFVPFLNCSGLLVYTDGLRIRAEWSPALPGGDATAYEVADNIRKFVSWSQRMEPA